MFQQFLQSLVITHPTDNNFQLLNNKKTKQIIMGRILDSKSVTTTWWRSRLRKLPTTNWFYNSARCSGLVGAPAEWEVTRPYDSHLLVHLERTKCAGHGQLLTMLQPTRRGLPQSSRCCVQPLGQNIPPIAALSSPLEHWLGSYGQRGEIRHSHPLPCREDESP